MVRLDMQESPTISSSRQGKRDMGDRVDIADMVNIADRLNIDRVHVAGTGEYGDKQT